MIKDFIYVSPAGPFLTVAEADLVRLRAMGLSHKEIAAKRKRSMPTIKNQFHMMYVKFGVHNFVQLLIKLGEIQKGERQ